MLQEQFYPTPKEVAEKMVAPYAKDIRDRSIIDPSAGAGHLLDAVLDCRIKWLQEKVPDYYDYHDREARSMKAQCHAIEIDPDLQATLRGKGYELIGEDFLSFNTPFHFDLWLMNPPFKDGAKHLLKAWEMCKGGDIVCLLNAETIKNPYTQERRLLQAIVEQHGTVEYLGQVFANSERPTDVEIAMVRLSKEHGDNLWDDIGGKKTSFEEMEEDFQHNQVTREGIIDQLLRVHQEAAHHYKQFRQAQARMNYLNSYFDFPPEREQLKAKHNASQGEQYNVYLKNLTNAAWRTLFRLTGFKNRMTSKVREQFEANQAKAASYEFSKENISMILDALVQNIGRMAKQCVLDAFDECTKYHKYNRVHVEGWKTNDAFKVTKKVILPNVVEFNFSGRYSLTYRAQWGIIADLDKAMCFLSGKRIEDIVTLPQAISEHESNRENRIIKKECRSEFFHIRYYKKGTVHITFLDDKLYERFNILVAKERGWLPEGWEEKETVSTDLVKL
jgi:predicted RNA methylase